MFNHFFENPTKWISPTGNGFVIFPHTDSVQEGWGEPITEDNLPTEGGYNNHSYLFFNDEGVWENTWADKTKQIAGNIDWKGEWIDEKTKEHRQTITWNGHKCRYLNQFGDGYYGYENEQRSNEIYQNGGFLTVGPAPVLSAAIIKDSGKDNQGRENTTQYIVIICYENKQDVAYFKELLDPTNIEDIDYYQDWKDIQSIKKDDENPDGWEIINSLGFQILAGQNTDVATKHLSPWFFNELGTQARTMRLTERRFTDEGGTGKNRFVWSEYTFVLQINNGVATGYFHNLGVDTKDKIVFTDKADKESSTWTDPVSNDWREDHIAIEVTNIGFLKFAVDWDVNKGHWVYGWINYDNSCLIEQYWSYGLSGANLGDRNGYQDPPGYTGKGNHTPQSWLGLYDRVSIEVGKNREDIDFKLYVGVTILGSEAEFLGDNDPSDTDINFISSYNLYLHHMDLRSGLFAGYIREEQALFEQWVKFYFTTSPNVDINLPTVNYLKQHLEWIGKATETNNLDYVFPGVQSNTEEYGETITLKKFEQMGWITALPTITFEWYDMWNNWPLNFSETFTRTDYHGTPNTDNIIIPADPPNEPGQPGIYQPDYRLYFRNKVYWQNKDSLPYGPDGDKIDYEAEKRYVSPGYLIKHPELPDQPDQPEPQPPLDSTDEPSRFESRSVLEYLLGTPNRDRHYRTGLFATNGDYNIANYEYIDEQTKEKKQIEKLWPDGKIHTYTTTKENYIPENTNRPPCGAI